MIDNASENVLFTNDYSKYYLICYHLKSNCLSHNFSCLPGVKALVYRIIENSREFYKKRTLSRLIDVTIKKRMLSIKTVPFNRTESTVKMYITITLADINLGLKSIP